MVDQFVFGIGRVHKNWGNDYLQQICSHLEAGGVKSCLWWHPRHDKPHFPNSINDPDKGLYKISQKTADALIQFDGAVQDRLCRHTSSCTPFAEIIGLLNKLVTQVEELKEEQDCYHEANEHENNKRADNGPTAGFERASLKLSIDEQNDRYDLRDEPVYNEEDEEFEWNTTQELTLEPNAVVDDGGPYSKAESPIYGSIGRLPPKETADTIIQFFKLWAEGKVPNNCPNHAYQPLFDGDISFVYVPSNIEVK